MKELASIITAVVLFSLCLFVSAKNIEKNIVSVIAENINNYPSHTVILDAGHGGEDSGAVADDGTLEKDINLSVCEKTALMFDIFGLKYIEIRKEDKSIGDTTLNTVRERKVSDIKARFDIINSTENAVLLSIHQNKFPVEKYYGTQVFYAKTETSDKLADFIQKSVIVSLQTNNTRKIKSCDNSVFLLDKAKVPSVMVECGFLSNSDELLMLKNDDYQVQLSYFITRGLIKYFTYYKDV